MFPACLLDRCCKLSSCLYSTSRYSQRVKTSRTAKSNNFVYKPARSKTRETAYEYVLIMASLGLKNLYR